MDAWRDIRLRARECHDEALAQSGGLTGGRALIEGALKANDLELHHYAPGTDVSEEVLGYLIANAGIVNIASGQSPEDEVVVVAHEIGHFKLHKDPRNEVTLINPGLGGDPIESGAGRVQGYSPRERKELQADIFAGEFLCPSDWLRTELLAGTTPSALAKELGLPQNLVTNQAIRALLLPPLRSIEREAVRASYELDTSQAAASAWTEGPVLVNAGPGTGKTRTLIDRIARQLESDPSPASFLALTFSNKAAEEMRERLVASGHVTIEMWVGTFHQFGLEIVHKWPACVGRSLDFKILDQTGQLALLEDNLTKLSLRHFQNLFEPAYELVHVLRAISRCKDEMISPAEYRTEAEAAKCAAVSDDEVERAEKALEIAHVYEVYEEELLKADAVDFGDLILLPIRILEENPAVLSEHQARFKHILVDEYQDVNYASARLLKLLAGGTSDLWVVADQRQSIYRFRGAKPSNVERFDGEFGGKALALDTNYRSGAPIVKAFQAFARAIQTGSRAPSTWQPNRGEIGSVSLTVAPTVGGEAAAIRDKVEQFSSEGVALQDQVILARSHLTLARITTALEELGVPLLYLGDLFERDEVRDLLSLLSIDAERGGLGLLRVAKLPEYDVPEDDILSFIHACVERGVDVIPALQDLDDFPGLSVEGLEGLARLGRHLNGFTRATQPWAMLTSWLFERSNYLAPLLERNDPKAQQQLIAIYQLLKVCGESATAGETSRRQFLDRIRRIEALNEETSYRAISSEATDFDAVRVMTIHGSKGLEFSAVHLPGMATRYMPSSFRGTRCPPPPELSHLGMGSSEHDAEEECLFFVALSRAKTHLSLSRAERYTNQNASASRFLPALGLRERRAPDFDLSDRDREDPPPAPRVTYSDRELTIYDRCPLRYKYEVVDGLAGAKDQTPYVRFHGCVHITINWLEEQRAAGKPADVAAALSRLASVWEESGPKSGFEPYYRQLAEQMIRNVAALITSEVCAYDDDDWSVELDGKQITFAPDRVMISDDGEVRIQRVRTGRKTKSEPDSPIYALIRLGAARRYPGKSVSVETYYPTTGETVPVATHRNEAKLLGSYSDRIKGIESGSFQKKPKDARSCPGCPCYLICGT